jgi:hypothetical protein
VSWIHLKYFRFSVVASKEVTVLWDVGPCSLKETNQVSDVLSASTTTAVLNETIQCNNSKDNHFGFIWLRIEISVLLL